MNEKLSNSLVNTVNVLLQFVLTNEKEAKLTLT